MSDTIGPIFYGGDDDENPFLGRDFSMGQRGHSEKIAVQIDDEVRKFILNAETKAREILTERRTVLDTMANALLDRETLDADEVLALAEGLELAAKVKVVIPLWGSKTTTEEKKKQAQVFTTPKPVTSS